MFNRGRDHKTAFAQIGHPVQPTIQTPATALRPGAHLQCLNPGEELHRIRQAGRTGQFATQQGWQQAFAQRCAGALQQVFDKGALAPEDKCRCKGMAGDFGQHFHGVGDIATAPTQRRADANAQYISARQLRHHLLRVAMAQIQRLGLSVQPVTQCRIEHVDFSVNSASADCRRC
ncbi:hypothetical protein D9M71_374220 [compost metagenome]